MLLVLGPHFETLCDTKFEILLVIWWFSIKVGFRKPGCSSVLEWHCLCCPSEPCLFSSSELHCVLVDLSLPFFFFFLTLAALCLHCCTWAFPGYREQGLLFVSGCSPLIGVASLVAEHGLQGSWVVLTCGLSLLWGMWNLPRLGIEPVSPALAGGFLSNEPPRKPSSLLYVQIVALLPQEWDGSHCFHMSSTIPRWES